MQLETKHFGSIEVDESGIIDFPDGLPGFENVKKYILLVRGTEDSPFKWLQSIDDPKLAFVVADTFAIKNDYDIEIDDKLLSTIEVQNESDLQIYSIVVIPEDISKTTINLKAPVIINTRSFKGMQVILDTDRYGVRHYIQEELRRQEGTGNAGFDKKKRTIDNNK
jgi:flagellar assembly factor FliW